MPHFCAELRAPGRPTSPALGVSAPCAGGPARIQRRRTRGWRLPAGARYVGRPTRWGNPWRVGPDRTATEAVAAFQAWVDGLAPEARAAFLAPLRGKDLACWCPPDAPCHADVLLELANENGAASGCPATLVRVGATGRLGGPQERR